MNSFSNDVVTRANMQYEYNNIIFDASIRNNNNSFGIW